jgi:hypothetical protein
MAMETEPTIDEMIFANETLDAFFPRMFAKKVYKQGWVVMTPDEYADYMRSCFVNFFLGDFLKEIHVREQTDTSTGESYFIAKAKFVSGDKPTEGILRFIKDVKNLNPNSREFIQLNLPEVFLRNDKVLKPFWKVIQDKTKAEPVLVFNADGEVQPY